MAECDPFLLLVGFKPKIADKAVHHMFIYGCEEPGTIDDVWYIS